MKIHILLIINKLEEGVKLIKDFKKCSFCKLRKIDFLCLVIIIIFFLSWLPTLTVDIVKGNRTIKINNLNQLNKKKYY